MRRRHHPPRTVAAAAGPCRASAGEGQSLSSLELERLGASLKCPASVVAKAEGFLRKAYTGAHCWAGRSWLVCQPPALRLLLVFARSPSTEMRYSNRRRCPSETAPTFRALSHCYCLRRVRLSVADLCAEFNAMRSRPQSDRRWRPSNFSSGHLFLKIVVPMLTFEARFAVAAFYMTAEKHKHVVKPPPKSELQAGDVEMTSSAY